MLFLVRGNHWPIHHLSKYTHTHQSLNSTHLYEYSNNKTIVLRVCHTIDLPVCSSDMQCVPSDTPTSDAHPCPSSPHVSIDNRHTIRNITYNTQPVIHCLSVCQTDTIVIILNHWNIKSLYFTYITLSTRLIDILALLFMKFEPFAISDIISNNNVINITKHQTYYNINAYSPVILNIIVFSNHNHTITIEPTCPVQKTLDILWTNICTSPEWNIN